MEIEVATQERVAILHVSGAIDALTADGLLAVFHRQITLGARHLVADLSEVDFASSAGLRAILSAQKAVRQQGGDLRLCGAQAQVRRVLELGRFTSIFKTYDTTAAAVDSFAGDWSMGGQL